MVPYFWSVDSSPFSAPGATPQPCRIVLRQLDDNDFQLVEPLVLTPPPGIPGLPSAPLVIGPGQLVSDLASVPEVLGWFARRHGRHTPAALVHDFLILGRDEAPPDGLPAEWHIDPAVADLLLREMLLASGVPPIRSYLMWSAVTAHTRWRSRTGRRWTMLAWGVTAAVGTLVLALGLARGDLATVAAALVAPVVAAGLWGRQYLAGLIAGYAVWWAVIGAVPAWMAYKLYQGVEGLVWLARRGWRDRGGRRAPEPPAPVPFDQR